MRYLSTHKFYCFSPPVMLATFVIEVAIVLWTIVRYKWSPVTRLVVAILVCLAVFQLAEYNVCTAAWGIDSLSWARVGYVAITLLPPLGIHLAYRLASAGTSKLMIGGYAAAAVFAAFFIVAEHGMQSYVCGGNYVIFHTMPILWPVYAFYYYGMLAAGTAYAFKSAAHTNNRHIAAALRWLAIGYTTFIVPTTFVNIVDPSTIAGIPSIMCGFAVILAVILGSGVLPASAAARGSRRVSR